MLERDLQARSLEYLESLGAYVMNTHGNPWERRGRPDLIICYCGKFIGIELKKGPENKPGPLQLKHLREIEHNGGIGRWLTSLQDLKDLLSLIHLRDHF